MQHKANIYATYIFLFRLLWAHFLSRGRGRGWFNSAMLLPWAFALNVVVYRHPPPAPNAIRGNLASITCNCLWDEQPRSRNEDELIQRSNGATTAESNEEHQLDDTLERETKRVLLSRSHGFIKNSSYVFFIFFRRSSLQVLQKCATFYAHFHAALRNTAHATGHTRQSQRSGNTSLGLSSAQAAQHAS